MAKKSRRIRRKGDKPQLSQAQLVQPTPIAVQETALVEEAIDATQPPEVTDFQDEYHYVVKDLQRIGLLAAAMLGGLVMLSFIL